MHELSYSTDRRPARRQLSLEMVDLGSWVLGSCLEPALSEERTPGPRIPCNEASADGPVWAAKLLARGRELH